jgi:8-oxo-dGTP diphosphatase
MYSYDYPHPAVATDVVVFTVRHNELEVLLIQRAEDPYAGAWALPGGFVEIDEPLEAAARRELQEETGIEDGDLEQLYTFGAPDRDPRERVITVAYYALIPAERSQIQAASDAGAACWFGLGELPVLAFDHAHILSLAQQRLKAQLNDSSIAFQLMPREFTLRQLQQVYESILNEHLDERNFRKRILALGLIEPTGGQQRDGARGPAKLYRCIHSDKVDGIKL